jgi:hypothetical protein
MVLEGPLTRLLAAALLLCLIGPGTSVGAQSAVRPLIDEQLLAGIHVRVTNGPEGMMIGIEVATAPPRRAGASQLITDIPDVQVWLLKVDGTALPQRRPGGGPVQVSMIRNGQRHLQRLLYVFEAADRRELAAVVVRLDGVLFIRPIPRATESVLPQP